LTFKTLKIQLPNPKLKALNKLPFPKLNAVVLQQQKNEAHSKKGQSARSKKETAHRLSHAT
jgi:hypothetical protein